jgi:hypothetical protein
MKNLNLFLALALGVFTISATTQTQKTWEYKVEYGVKESKINSLASQGWELVATGSDNAAMTPVPYLVFKRSK